MTLFQGILLSEVMGQNFQPKYENLLTLIPWEQITYVDPQPIGHGDRGVVCKGVWSCPKTTFNQPAAKIDVALRTRDLKNFMHELDGTKGSPDGKTGDFHL